MDKTDKGYVKYTMDDLRNLTDEEWAGIDNFTKEEFACQETGEHGATRALVLRVSTLRGMVEKPLIISSGYRSPRHRIEARKKEPGTHAMGMAVDIKCHGELAYTILEKARLCGFFGIGIKQHGAMESRFIHLDIVLPGSHDRIIRPNVWSYPA